MRVMGIAALALVAGTAAAAAKDTRFWNLTANTVTLLQFSPPGKDAWGPDRTKSDKDGSVDHDERLKIAALKSGTYDVRVGDAKRICVVRNVAVAEGKVFSIDEKAMTDCK